MTECGNESLDNLKKKKKKKDTPDYFAVFARILRQLSFWTAAHSVL